MSEVFRAIEPEPILIGFLGKYSLNRAEIVGEEIRIIGVNRQSEDLKIVRRSVTIDEIDQVAQWIDTSPQGPAKNTSIVSFNMKMLQGLRAKMPLSPKPLP